MSDLPIVKRGLRADHLLAENIRTLLRRRGIDASALAVWCGHRKAWISKVLAQERGIQIKDLGKIADFFGITVADLFQHGISPLTERRRTQRRAPSDRRLGQDRRGQPRHTVHPDVPMRFPAKHVEEDEDEHTGTEG